MFTGGIAFFDTLFVIVSIASPCASVAFHSITFFELFADPYRIMLALDWRKDVLRRTPGHFEKKRCRVSRFSVLKFIDVRICLLSPLCSIAAFMLLRQTASEVLRFLGHHLGIERPISTNTRNVRTIRGSRGLQDAACDGLSMML